MLTLTAATQQIPPDHRGGHVLERDELSATASTYDEAVEQLHAQLPNGWRILHLQVDRT